jgi:CrcB protein
MKVLWNCLAVGLGGVVGALARYGVGLASVRVFGRGFPVGTLIVNLTGSFLVGWFFAWEAGRTGAGAASDTPRLAVVVGFAGAYTTFSALMFETSALYRDGAAGRAALNLIGSVALGLLAVTLGALAGARS